MLEQIATLAPSSVVLVVSFIAAVVAAASLPLIYMNRAYQSFLRPMQRSLDQATKETLVMSKKISALTELMDLYACGNAGFCENRRYTSMPRFGSYCHDCNYDSCLDCPLSGIKS